MAKKFLCPCGRKWLVYIGSDFTSGCCYREMTPMDDGEPMPPAKMEFKEASKLFGDDDEPTKH